MDSSASPGWGLYVLWVVGSGVGALVAELVFRPLSLVVGGRVGVLLGGVAGEAVVGVLAMGGVFLGIAIAQALVLRAHASWGGWWVLALVLSAALAGACMLAAFEALGGTAGIVLGMVGGLTLFAGIQWLVLRGLVPWAGKLVIASTLGLMAAMPATALLGAFGYGAAYGVVTGAVLMWQLGRYGAGL